MTLTKREKKGGPILELTVRQIHKDGRKVRGGSAWTTYIQKEIRSALPNRIREHFGLKRRPR